MAGHKSIVSALRTTAQRFPDAPAILGCGHRPLCFSKLVEQVERAGATLKALGVGRADRVATVLSNGPEAALAFLSVASAGVCAPLNPGYSANEFEFYFSDLQPKALIVEAGNESPAIRVATTLDIPVFRLIPRPQSGAGTFDLEGSRPAAREGAGEPGPDDLALVLHTSGSTSRPKLVPLTHANLYVSAQTIAASLGLSPTRPLPEYHAAVPYSWTDRRGALFADLRRKRGVQSRNARAQLFRLASGV